MTITVAASNLGEKCLPLSRAQFSHSGANSSELNSCHTGCLDVAGLGDLGELVEIVVRGTAAGLVSNEI
jgi:hypothetical protein